MRRFSDIRGWKILADTAEPNDVQIGISRTCTPASDYRRRYRELRKCLDLANRANPAVRTVVAEQWHVHTMLMHTADDDDVRDRAHQLLDLVLAEGDDRLLISRATHRTRPP